MPKDQVAGASDIALSVELYPIDLLDELPGNPNFGDDQALADSYATFGQVKPIVTRRKGRSKRRTVYAGNTQLRAAKELGWTHLAIVTVPTHWSDAKALAYALADNRTPQLGHLEDQLLLNAIDLVQDEALLVAAGYRQEFVEDLRETVNPTTVVPGSDDVPTPKRAISRRGDVWVLPGGHKVMCGDATDQADYAALMDGHHADLVWTDPPYGVDYTGGQQESKRERIAGDHDVALFAASLPVLAAQARPKAPFYIWHAGSLAGAVYAACDQAGLTVRSQIIWNKLNPHYGAWMAQYMQRHEPCLYCHKTGQAPYWFGPTNEVSVWDVEQPSRNELHPTQKPVELATRAILNSSKRGAIVLDPFGGSGTCLMAAIATERICYTMDVDPTYVDTMCLRYQLETGGKPVRLSDGKEVSFE